MPTHPTPLPTLHRLLRWWGWVLVGCLAANAFAQNVSLRYHTQSDGLSNLAVTALVQAADGRLWIGTENGLFRYDGARITRVDSAEAPMPSRHISALASDGRGGLWVGTIRGVFHLNEDRLEPVQTAGGSFVVRQGQTIASMPDSTALVSTVDGLYAIQRNAAGAWHATLAFEAALLGREPSLATVHAVLVDKDGAWWLACGNALCQWRAGTLLRSREHPSDSPWARLLRSSDGALWVRSQTRVLRRAAGANDFEDVTPANLSHGMVHLHQPLVEDGDGRVITSSDRGLLRWQAGRWEFFGAAQGLEIGGGLHTILVDRQQDVWLGTAGLGLGHWRGYRHWRHWTRRQGLLSEDVWTFAEEPSGRIWIGTSEGAAARERGGVEWLVPKGATNDQVGSIARDALGQVWMATYTGQLLRREATGAWQRVATGLPLVLMLKPATGGGLWMGADKGLYFVEPSRVGAAPPKVRPPPGMDDRQAQSMTVFAACASPQRWTWFGTSAGLMAHDYARGVIQPEVLGLPLGLSIEKLSCGNDGVLWAATRDNRLWRITEVSRTWSAQEILPGAVLGRRSVMGLLADSRGWLWVTTDDGVLVWNGNLWRRFDDSNGLAWNDCNQNAIYEDAAGDVWIGTSRGASQVVAPKELFDPVQVGLDFTQVTRDGRTLGHDTAWTADWSAGALQITWFVPTMTNRSAQQVRYRLRGLSDQWSNTQHDDVSFAALPAGRYTFEAQAENIDLGLKSNVAMLTFEILPPWWLSSWAMAAYAAAALALVALAYRWRVRVLVRRQRQLELLVGQRTAELETSYEQMRTLALSDSLTGAMNRRAITDMAVRELAHARRGEAAVTFVLLDVDHFKRINDTHGHPAGDAVLTQLVRRLRGAMRDYDAIGRWGGEEFLLVLPGLSLSQQEARHRVETLRRCISEQPFDIGTGTPLVVTCSAGVVAASAGAVEALETLIGQADAALYDAKRDGRNRTVFAS